MNDKRYKEEEKLDRLLGERREKYAPGGFKVPEGYFEHMADEIVSGLDKQQPVQRFVKMTRWQKLKPYVYLAAMFCGIWLMMNILHRVTGDGSISLENPPERMAQLMNTPEVQENYAIIPTSLLSDIEVEEEVSEAYDNIEDFAEDFENAGTDYYDEADNEHATDDEIDY